MKKFLSISTIIIVEFLILGVCFQKVMSLCGVSRENVEQAVSCTISEVQPIYETGVETITQIADGIDTDTPYKTLNFDTRFYPYYGMLNEREQCLYKQIYYATTNFKQEIVPCVNLSSDDAEKVMNAVMFDHPEIFWMGTGYQFTYSLNDIFTLLTFSYSFREEDCNAAKLQLEMVTSEILNGAGNYATDLDKERYVHDYIIEHANYNGSNVFAGQNLYSALVDGSTVCAGYSRAFQYIMTRLGIPTYYCVGISEGDHAWNIIKINGEYYNVDLTWDDTGETTQYFNCSDQEIASSHVRSGLSVQLPQCSV